MSRINYTILIICEGEKTEPLFFNSIRDKLIENDFNNDIRNLRLTIAPEPITDIDENIDIKIKHKAKRKKRKTKNIEGFIVIEDGKPPLRWIKTAQRELETGAYDEVWAVFDNDNHPAKEEAFAESKRRINGSIVNIAYSSLSFEYYLLMHFERLYKTFNKTDCKDKGVFLRCGTNLNPEKDCMGEICINGYAQEKKYWGNSNEKNTKNSTEIFSLIEDKIETGFENASWIRYKSAILQADTPIYNRNPYLSTDTIVRKLIGNDNVYEWINQNEESIFDAIGINVKIENQQIKIINSSDRTIIFPENSISIISDKKMFSFGDRELISVGNDISFDISDYLKGNSWFKISYKNYRIMFDNNA